MSLILVIGDDRVAADTLERHLERTGHTVVVVGTTEEGLSALASDVFDVVVADLPATSAVDVLEAIRGDDAPPVIVITGDGSARSGVAATRAGATGWVSKPLSLAELDVALARALEAEDLRRRVARLQREVEVDPDPTLTARSRAMLDALELARRCATSAVTAALIVGESCAGREAMAAFVHRQSPRANGPFVRVNVASIPDAAIEAELFGATRGASTGPSRGPSRHPSRDRRGCFAAANGGTLLLDEIGALRPELQGKLLRAIETGRFLPLGATREVSSDVRILAATNGDPAEAVESGRLRLDVYRRLSTMLIPVPPLRARREDVPAIARAWLEHLRRSSGRGPGAFTDDALAALAGREWPGDVRELRNAIERVAILVDGDVASVDDLRRLALLGDARARAADDDRDGGSTIELSLPEADAPSPAPLEAAVRAALEQVERRYIEAILARTFGNRTRAAEILGVSRSTLWLKLRKYGLEDTPPRG